MLRFVLDECLSKKLSTAIQHRNHALPHEWIDAIRVGDIPELPYGTLDPQILIWAEQHNRIVVTVDYSTMPVHFTDHLAEGRHSSGLICIRPGAKMLAVADDMAMIAHAGKPDDFYDTIEHIPI